MHGAPCPSGHVECLRIYESENGQRGGPDHGLRGEKNQPSKPSGHGTPRISCQPFWEVSLDTRVYMIPLGLKNI